MIGPIPAAPIVTAFGQVGLYARLRRDAPFVQPALTRLVARVLTHDAVFAIDARLILADALLDAARELDWEGDEGRPTARSLRALACSLADPDPRP